MKPHFKLTDINGPLPRLDITNADHINVIYTPDADGYPGTLTIQVQDQTVFTVTGYTGSYFQGPTYLDPDPHDRFTPTTELPQ